MESVTVTSAPLSFVSSTSPYLILRPLACSSLTTISFPCSIPMTHTYALTLASNTYPPTASQHTLFCTRVALRSIITNPLYTSLLLLMITFSCAHLTRLPCALTITSYLVCALASLCIKPVAYSSVFFNLNLTCIPLNPVHS